jgi:predicted GH43/DUF377 family glycosyl hydrolase
VLLPTRADLGYRLDRLGIVMTAELSDPYERLGVLNPALARDGSGETYLFPRIVAEGNYSRIARVRVIFDGAGHPSAVERLSVVLEPSEVWENNSEGGGVEDPRITRLEALGVWAMTYTAYGPLGPKIGLAVSTDLAAWDRLGPIWFVYDAQYKTDFNLYPNKDAVLFPSVVSAPDGRPSFAMLHRPSFDLWAIRPNEGHVPPAGVDETRQSIWVSFAPLEELGSSRGPIKFGQHRFVAGPQQPWEDVKIGAGPAPMLTDDGWLVLYHGVAGTLSYDWPQSGVRYSAGAMLLDTNDVTKVLWRSTEPLLVPQLTEELTGVLPNVVFPTAIDQRPDGTIHVYFGMADDKIGVAKLSKVLH